MKTRLLICPTTTAPIQAQHYVVLWPHDGTYHILWRMWCSSLRWALQDAAQDFTQFLNEMYPDGWEIHYRRFQRQSEIAEAARTLNLRQTYDWPRLRAVRRRYKLPPWSHEPDQYQEPIW